jgi:hypothetical protein
LLGAVAAYGIPRAEAEPAGEHHAKEDEQQRAIAQREFSIGPRLGRLRLSVVEWSPHASSSASEYCME